MTTTAQVKRAMRPLLQKHQDFELIGRLLVIKPINHVLRGIVIDRTGSAARFKPKWFMVHLFEHRTSYPLSWGHELFRRSHGLWFWCNPDSIPVLIEEIEQNALPQLQAIQTVEDFVAFVTAHPRSHHLADPPTKLVVDVALGNLESAREICTGFLPKYTEATYGRDAEDKMQFRNLKELCRRLVLDDRAGLAALLHETEAQTVKNLKLDHLWQPSPFPLELQPAQPS
jgi:hypothetical protein